jgi:hypothetical protein
VYQRSVAGCMQDHLSQDQLHSPPESCCDSVDPVGLLSQSNAGTPTVKKQAVYEGVQQ